MFCTFAHICNKMEFFHLFLDSYGLEGTILAAVILVLFSLQLYYYIFVYGRIPKYRNNLRPVTLQEAPPVSVVVPLFSEDFTFVSERLPLLLAQDYPLFEVVVVYVGQDNDFYEDFLHMKDSSPNLVITKFQLNPRFPISRKMALNLGIKSAHYEHLIFTSTDAFPETDGWLSLMAKGYMRGDVVLGYCGVERGKGLSNYLMRACRMMSSADWIARATGGKAYRGTLHNFGFTKSLYFGVKGFGNLNMNVGEDDLFLQQIMTRENVSVVLTPRATLYEKTWGGMAWWNDRLRYFGSTARFYPAAVRNFVQWEVGSRFLFLLTTLCALCALPLEFKAVALLLLLVRYAVVAWQVKRIARRLGEERMAGRYFIYDLLGIFWSFALGVILLRKDERVWRSPII